MSNTVRRTPKTLGEARAARMANPLVAAIVGAPDIPFKDVEVPEWGGIELRIKGLSGTARDEYEARMFTLRATQDDDVRIDLAANRNAKILAQCLFDPETDEPLPITEEELGAKSGVVTARLAGIALGLSGLGRDAIDAAGKGSASAPSDSSTSD